MEIKTISVQVHRTPDGKPTCARNFETGEVCHFLLVQRFGTEHTCVFSNTGQRGRKTVLESTGADGSGFLVPSTACPLHNPTRADNGL